MLYVADAPTHGVLAAILGDELAHRLHPCLLGQNIDQAHVV